MLLKNIYKIDKYNLSTYYSIYLDKYKEDDYRIKRGKPLFLSNERLEYLQKIWATGGGPMDISHEYVHVEFFNFRSFFK